MNPNKRDTVDYDQLVAIITTLLVAPESRLPRGLDDSDDRVLQDWVQTARAIVQASVSGR